MFPLVVVGLLVLLLSSSKRPEAQGLRPEELTPPPTPPPAPKPPHASSLKPSAPSVVTMAPDETWGILARSLQPMTDDAWSSFASNLYDAMRVVGASVQDFKIGTGGSFAYSIVPNVVIKLSVPSTSADFRIEKVERLSPAPSV